MIKIAYDCQYHLTKEKERKKTPIETLKYDPKVHFSIIQLDTHVFCASEATYISNQSLECLPHRHRCRWRRWTSDRSCSPSLEDLQTKPKRSVFNRKLRNRVSAEQYKNEEEKWVISRKTDSSPLAFLPMSEKSPGPLLIVAETDREKERDCNFGREREREVRKRKWKCKGLALFIFVVASLCSYQRLSLPPAATSLYNRWFQYPNLRESGTPFCFFSSSSSLLDLWN